MMVLVKSRADYFGCCSRQSGKMAAVDSFGGSTVAVAVGTVADTADHTSAVIV